ncbi:MAG: phosphatase PAP2 family protein [Actinobacteria bacterium]|nr:phosphatase PAP2 family protein [Actinomycetota bacterium]
MFLGGRRAGLVERVLELDERIDAAWARTLRGRPLVDRAFYLASELGDFSLIWHLIGAAQGLRSDEDADATARLAVVLLAESLLVNQGVKRLVRRPRPLHEAIRPHALRTPRTSSFPSGHASSAFTAAGVLADRDPDLAPLYYAVAVVVATSRIHVRIHHASDVVAGAALGFVLAKVALRLWPLPPHRARPADRAPGTPATPLP